jgi:hypothetical protein
MAVGISSDDSAELLAGFLLLNYRLKALKKTTGLARRVRSLLR